MHCKIIFATAAEKSMQQRSFQIFINQQVFLLTPVTVEDPQQVSHTKRSLISFSPLTVVFYLNFSSRKRQIETMEAENKLFVCLHFSERSVFYDTKYSFV